MSAYRFEDALRRLLQITRERVRAGDLSERRLARLAGFSQPHMHNLLAGKRALLPRVADRLLEALALTLQDVAGGGRPPALEGAVSRLTGPVGGGRAFPSLSSQPPVVFFNPARVAGLRAPALTRVAAEEISMRPTLHPGDDILLECAPTARRRPAPGAIYAISWMGASYLCRCRISMGALIATAEASSAAQAPARMPLEGRRVEEIIRGEVVWYGRSLRSP